MSYDVSVVIPTHNDGETLRRAINSAFEAGANDVTVVNDASTDDTDVVLWSAKKKYSHLYVTESADFPFPAGVCHARNIAISKAKHDFIIPLDADDYLMPDGIKLLYQTRKYHAVIYGGHLKAESGEIVSAPPPQRLAQKNLTGATYGFWKEDWEKAGGYHPDFNIGCEDWAFMAALVSAGVQLIRVDEPVYVYSPGGKRAARCIQYADTIRKLLAEHYPAVFNAQQSG